MDDLLLFKLMGILYLTEFSLMEQFKWKIFLSKYKVASSFFGK